MVSPMRRKYQSALGDDGASAPTLSHTTSLSLILPKLQQGGVTRSQEGRATRSPESGASGSSIRRRCQSDSKESGGNGPYPKATQLSHCHPLSLPRPLHSRPGSSLLSRAHSLLGGATGSTENGAIAFSQVDAVWRGKLHPRKMESAVWEVGSAQGSCWLSLQLSPQSHTTQSLLIPL